MKTLDFNFREKSNPIKNFVSKENEKNPVQSDIVKKINDLYSASRQAKFQDTLQWIMNFNHYYGNPVLLDNRYNQVIKSKKYAVWVNIVGPNIENRISRMIARSGTFEVEPEFSGTIQNEQAARGCLKAVKYIKCISGIDDEHSEWRVWTHNAGNYFVEVYYDKNSGKNKLLAYYDTETGEYLFQPNEETLKLKGNKLKPVNDAEGQLVIDGWNPFEVYTRPGIKDIKYLNEILLIREVPEETIKDMFGNKIYEKKSISKTSEKNANYYNYNVNDLSIFDSYFPGNTPTSTLYKYYEKPSISYPKGRLVFLVNNIVVYEGDNPTPDYELPVIHLYQKKTPGKFWKLPIVSEIRALQNEYCHIKTQMKFTRKTSGNLTAFVEGDTQISVEQMKDYPALIIRRKSKANKNGADNTRFEGALRTPETSLDWQLKQVKSDVQDILQLYDVYSGRNPSNVTAGIALSQLSQENQQNLSREVKNCENQISQIINLGIKTIKINYSDERLADLIGEEFDFYYFKNIRDSLNLKIKITPFSMMPVDIISKRQYFLDLARFAPQYLQTIEFDDLLADTEFGGVEDKYAKREKIISKALKECRRISECFDKNGNIITPPKLKVDLFDEHKIEFKVHKEYLASKEWELKKEFIIKNISVQLAMYIEENLKQHLAMHEQGIMSLQAMRQPQLMQPPSARQDNSEQIEAEAV